MAKIHRSTGQRIFPFTAARKKNKSRWDQLELLIIPGVLAAGAFFVHDQLAQKHKSNTAASLAKPEVLFVQPSNPSAQSTIEQDLPESEPVNEEQVLIQTSTDNELSWIDRPIRGQLRKSLRREDLIRPNGKITSLHEINSSRKTHLLGIKFGKVDPTSPNLQAALLHKLVFTTDQTFPKGLFIDNHTRVNLSGVDLFGNHLTNSALFETKLIKADFRGASFSKAGQINHDFPANHDFVNHDFPDVSLLGTDPLRTAILSIDLSKADFLKTEPTSVYPSGTKLIKISPLGANLSKIGLIEANFGTTTLDDTSSSKENLSKINPSSDDLHKQEPVTENLGAADFSEPSQIQTSSNEAELSEDISVTSDQ